MKQVAAIPVNGQRFLLEALIACGQEPGDNILPLSVAPFFCKGATRCAAAPSNRKSSQSAIASKVRVLLHAVVDRRYTNFCKSKKAAPESSEAALTLFC